ncbi:type I-E CRISPR-associated endonuclease Cas1e [Corynebacterium nuruki]|jgi:CRISPR-associated protein Cas1|uniref:CRISPR-associated endonuclease Cas1 n=1 Tax=Corynebacterium nuruki TaxID=1032851 RepID=A0A3D4SW59_9CORY|nr:type I-E CRISPR-associated endonuclease Cas1e [Corynebacterium nuruki]HCT13523.1 type I-E CRISPR-associated endonuclease Cas1 [Corynebacterium nuruki]
MNGGLPPSTPRQLARVTDRVSFLYLEHCTLGRDGGALTATDESGVIHVPVAALSVLMLGPGTRLTHQAVAVVADAGCSLVWVGEEGVRYYAHGRSIARSTRLLEAQAKKVSNTRSRLAVAREMYAMRFSDDTTGLTMQQLRGKEGARVRQIYRKCSESTGVAWKRRTYDPNNFSGGDPINQALSAAHSALYGLSHAVITALGCSPGLGFVHTGHDRSFVYDVADLYKAECTIPIAFNVVKKIQDDGTADFADIAGITRRAVRDRIKELRLPEQMAHDLAVLLVGDREQPDDGEFWADVVQLWDEKDHSVVGGMNYSDDAADHAVESPDRP